MVEPLTVSEWVAQFPDKPSEKCTVSVKVNPLVSLARASVGPCEGIRWLGSTCPACQRAWEETERWTCGISVHHEGFRGVFEGKMLHYHHQLLKVLGFDMGVTP